MERGRRFRDAPRSPEQADEASRRRARRAVVDDTRRRIERALVVAEAAEELAQAAESALGPAETERIGLDSESLSALRAALAKYRQARRMSP